MISNQTLQNTIDGLHQITKIDFAVVDSEGGVGIHTERTGTIS